VCLLDELRTDPLPLLRERGLPVPAQQLERPLACSLRLVEELDGDLATVRAVEPGEVQRPLADDRVGEIGSAGRGVRVVEQRPRQLVRERRDRELRSSSSNDAPSPCGRNTSGIAST